MTTNEPVQRRAISIDPGRFIKGLILFFIFLWLAPGIFMSAFIALCLILGGG